MNRDFQVTVKDQQRAAEWISWIGTDTIVVKSPIPEARRGPKHEVLSFFLANFEALTSSQQAGLLNGIAEKWKVSTEEVLNDIQCQGGVPVLADDCQVTVYNPQRWL